MAFLASSYFADDQLTTSIRNAIELSQESETFSEAQFLKEYSCITNLVVLQHMKDMRERLASGGHTRGAQFKAEWSSEEGESMHPVHFERSSGYATAVLEEWTPEKGTVEVNNRTGKESTGKKRARDETVQGGQQQGSREGGEPTSVPRPVEEDEDLPCDDRRRLGREVEEDEE